MPRQREGDSVPSKADVRADEDVRLVIDTEKLHIFDKETEKTICN